MGIPNNAVFALEKYNDFREVDKAASAVAERMADADPDKVSALMATLTNDPTEEHMGKAEATAFLAKLTGIDIAGKELSDRESMLIEAQAARDVRNGVPLSVARRRRTDEHLEQRAWERRMDAVTVLNGCTGLWREIVKERGLEAAVEAYQPPQETAAEKAAKLRAEIMAIKDEGKRRAAIAANIGLWDYR